MARPARPLSLRLTLRRSAGPLRHGIAEALLDEVRAGRLRPGDALPPTRSLATELGVSRAVVVAAYDELAAAGFTDARAGSGTFLASGADEAVAAGAASHVTPPLRGEPPARAPGESAPLVGRPEPAEPPVVDRDGARGTHPPLRWDLAAGRPDTSLIHGGDWRRAWREAARAPIDDDTSFRAGHPQLQRELAAHLRRTRAIVVDPADLVIVPGVSAAIRAVAVAAALVGSDVVVEDPGYAEARIALRAAGAWTRAVPVDDDGLDSRRLRPSDRAVYVTPAHQFPMGGRMPAHRRAALVHWATGSRALVLEDDYDGEFRYGAAALPALRSLEGASGVVAYIGTVSKVLTPSLRIAWVAAPRHVLPALRDVVVGERMGVDRVAGHALAALIASGALSRHIVRTSRLYASRRTALVTALRRHLPRIPLVGVDAGLHVVAMLPDGTDDVDLSRGLRSAGIRAEPLSASAVKDRRRGLVLGYARLPEGEAENLARTLATTVARAVGPFGSSARADEAGR